LDPGTGAYSIARSITVDGPAILAVGHDTVAGVAPIDVAGATIVPAFADSHVHLDATGMRDGPNDLSEIDSAAAFDDRLAALAVGPRVYAAGFDDALWTEPASARVLDSRHAEAIALVVRVDGHSSIVNRKTWRWLDLDPALDGVERDANGEPTGRLFREANWQAQARYFATISTSERRAATERACASALAQGIAYLHAQLLTLGSRQAYADEVAFLRSLENVRVFPKICERDPELALALGLPFVGGDVFLDGSLGSGTAALCEPYRDRPGNGALALSDAEADAYFAEAEALGISAGVHAIGDRAIEQALQAIERAQGGKRSERTRHFIEHAELASDDHLAACARLGVHLSMQPQFDAQWGSPGGMYDARLGPQRRATMNRIRSARIAGVHVSGGSDSPVCRLSALEGMAAACAHHDPAERLDPLEALSLYTYESARLAHAERNIGAIAPGFEASFAILDSDPFVNGSFAQTRVIGTWHRGRNVYRAV
jgi:predicted amidohydrolase YtcJ